MRLDPSLNVMLEGSLDNLPAAVNVEEAREREHQVPEERPQGSPFETSIEGTPDTLLKVKLESSVRQSPRRIQRTREASVTIFYCYLLLILVLESASREDTVAST